MLRGSVVRTVVLSAVFLLLTAVHGGFSLDHSAFGPNTAFAAGGADTDGDGVPDSHDNCPNVANPSQADFDGDKEGDACEDDPDGDLIGNDTDNCPNAPNQDQGDFDGDGVGDACDPDGKNNADHDGDGVTNDKDNCPHTKNPDQADLDKDGKGDVCDPDKDGDGVENEWDNCPMTHNPDQKDKDGDGKGDACDPDVDCIFNTGVSVVTLNHVCIHPPANKIYCAGDSKRTGWKLAKTGQYVPDAWFVPLGHGCDSNISDHYFNFKNVGGKICGCERKADLGCFAPGTQIEMGDRSYRSVEDISAGDLVWNPATGSAARVTKVVESLEKDPFIEIGTVSGVATVTQTHPVVTARGLVLAKDLTPEDLVLDANGLLVSLVSLVELPYEPGQWVVNFRLEDLTGDDSEHLVVSDGIVTGDLELQIRLNG